MVSSPSFFFPSLTKSLAHSLTHSLTRSLTHTLVHSLTHSLTLTQFIFRSPFSSHVSPPVSVHVPNILLCVIHVSLCPCPQHPPVCHTCISLSMSPTSSCVSYMYLSVHVPNILLCVIHVSLCLCHCMCVHSPFKSNGQTVKHKPFKNENTSFREQHLFVNEFLSIDNVSTCMYMSCLGSSVVEFDDAHVERSV